MTQGLVLASASAARRAMLKNAGVDVVAHPAQLDETALLAECRSKAMDAAEAAKFLARAKAQAVEGEAVIGADQILDVDGAWFEKPVNLDAAREQLRRLRGRTHRLASAVAFRRGPQVWSRAEEARLTMRDFSDAFLDDYLARMGDQALSSVGAYHIEGLGAQLFEKIEGDPFVIMGMPLLPLLKVLRADGVLKQ